MTRTLSRPRALLCAMTASSALACALPSLAAAELHAERTTDAQGNVVLTVTADAGESTNGNVSTGTFSGGNVNNVQVYDGTNGVIAGEGCTQADTLADCGNASEIDFIVVSLGDGDDTFRVTEYVTGKLGYEESEISGGPGIDKLTGYTGIDYLYGGSEADELRGGSNADELYGEDGDDKLEVGTGTGGDPSDGDDLLAGEGGNDRAYAANLEDGGDTFFGGDGSDEMLYGARGSGVVASIGDGANDGADPDGNGETQEGDDVRGDVEVLQGSQGEDYLEGGPGPNDLVGMEGDDVLNSRDGAGGDELFCDRNSAFDGTDLAVIDGGDITGTGNPHYCDVIQVPGGGAAGPANNADNGGKAVDLGALAAIAAAADVGEFGRVLSKLGARRAGKRGFFTGKADAPVPGTWALAVDTGGAKVAAAARKVQIAKASVRFSSPGAKKVKVKLTKKGRKYLRKRRKATKVTVRISFTPQGGRKVTRTKTVKLKR